MPFVKFDFGDRGSSRFGINRRQKADGRWQIAAVSSAFCYLPSAFWFLHELPSAVCLLQFSAVSRLRLRRPPSQRSAVTDPPVVEQSSASPSHTSATASVAR